MPFTRFFGLLHKAATFSTPTTLRELPPAGTGPYLLDSLTRREMPSAGKGSYQWDALTLFQLSEHLKQTETNNSADAAHETTQLDPKQ